MNQSTRIEIFKRILHLCFLHPVYMTGAIVLAIVSALSYFVPYLVIYYILRVIFKHGLALHAEEMGQILFLGIVAVIGVIVNIVTFYGSLICSHHAAFDTAFELRIDFAKKLYQLPMGFHIAEGSGKLKGILDDNIGSIQSFIAHKIPDLVAGIIYPAAMIIIMVFVDWRLGIALLLGIGVAYIFHLLSMGRGGTKHMMELYYASLATLENRSVEFVRGIPLIRIFGRGIFPHKAFISSAKDYSNMAIPYTREWEKYMSWFEALMRNLYLFLIPVGIFIGTKSDIGSFAPGFLFYLIITPSLASVIPKINSIMDAFMRVNEEALRVDCVMKEPVIEDSDDKVEISSHDISFEHVCFSYTEKGEQKALKDISFNVPQGTITAIIGGSGSGKSTIAALMARFWECKEGSISIGGVDISKIPIKGLMKHISFVFQNDYLFSDTVFNNLTMGESKSMEEVVLATKAAHCHDFIEALPDGYNTKIGDSSNHLSAGQCQRIFIARAILKNAPIVVLDEATASLDAENEWMIRESFNTLLAGKTVLIIAHQLHMTRFANQVLVLKDGSIIEKGCHDELIEKGDTYVKMWETWKRIKAWKIVSKGGNA